MSTGQQTHGAVEVDIENVGGIESTEVTFSPGVTLLVGRNATNRTSLLRAIQAACGSHDVSVKGDADQGQVSISVDGERRDLELSRTGGSVRIDGEPLLENPMEAELFAFLLGSNEARQAVGGAGDLRELVMRPVDVDEISAQIDRLVEEREEIDRTLATIDERKSELPKFEERRQHLESKIDETEAELREVEERLEAEEADIEESRTEQAELEDRLDELSQTRSALEDARYRLETERESLDALATERSDLATEREEMAAAPTGEIEELDATLRRLRDRKQHLESEVSDIQRLVQFNRDMMEEGVQAIGVSAADDSVTDALVEGDTRRCWTCGSEVDREQIQSTVDRLRDARETRAEELADVEADIEEAKTERDGLEAQRRRTDQIERRLGELETEIENTEATITELEQQRETLSKEIEELESAVDSLDDAEYGDVIEIHKEANQLEYELGRLESERDQVAEQIAAMEDEIAQEDDLSERRTAIQDQIENLRTRIDQIEGDVIEEFNDHMDQLLERLGYENIERIWLERTGVEARDGTLDESEFRLHVVRTSDSGVSYEDSVEHLSESERELAGLVFALAGYLAHKVYETVPFMLLDSVEAIDAQRIDAIVDYLREYPEYLVVALLPEDAAAVDDSYARITEI